MSNVDQATTGKAAKAPAQPAADAPQASFEDDVARIAEGLASLNQRQADLFQRVGAIDKALATVMELSKTVTDLSRRVDHVTDQLGAHATTVQGAAEAHGSTNALGQDVLSQVGRLRRDVEEFARSLNKPFGDAA